MQIWDTLPSEGFGALRYAITHPWDTLPSEGFGALRYAITHPTNTIDTEIFLYMPTVYLKGGGTVDVSLEDLEDYLRENRERIETRRKNLRRPPVDSITT